MQIIYTVFAFFQFIVKEEFGIFAKYAYSGSCRELDEKIDITLMSVC